MDGLRGIGLIVRTPRLWPLCLGPLAVIFALYLLLDCIGGWLLVPRLETWLATFPNSGGFLIAVEALAVLLWLLLFPFLFVLLGGVLLFGVLLMLGLVVGGTLLVLRHEKDTAPAVR